MLEHPMTMYTLHTRFVYTTAAAPSLLEILCRLARTQCHIVFTSVRCFVVSTACVVVPRVGPRPNSKLLQFSGFVDATNRFDTLDVFVDLDSARAEVDAKDRVDDPLKKVKLMLLKNSGFASTPNGTFGLRLPLPDISAPSIAVSESDLPSEIAEKQELRQRTRAQFQALMLYVRIACLSTKDAAALALKHKPTASVTVGSLSIMPPLYPQHDLEAYTWLHDALVGKLHSYGTSIEDDEQLLLRDEAMLEAEEHELVGAVLSDKQRLHHPHSLPKQKRLAVELRRAEKKLLVQACELALRWKESQHKSVEPAASSSPVAASSSSTPASTE